MKNNKHIVYPLTIFLLLLTSCKKSTHSDTEEKYRWGVEMSAPKYYLIGSSRVDFGNEGGSRLTNFDSGWGDPYGVIVGEKYKTIPKEVYIKYTSAVENLDYEGTVALPQDTLKKLFTTYCKDKEQDSGILLVGMAPGGWIRVWAYFFSGQDITEHFELVKAQLKGKEDSAISDAFKYKKSDYWTPYKKYWQHFGKSEEFWAENEKEYNLFLNFSKPNANYKIGSQFISRDGTTIGDWKDDPNMKAKLPADLVLGWWSLDNTQFYDTHVLMPKNFSKIVETKKTNTVEIQLEIEKNEEYGVLYLITHNKKEKILRFKSKKKSRELAVGDSDFSEEVEYFMQ